MCWLKFNLRYFMALSFREFTVLEVLYVSFTFFVARRSGSVPSPAMGSPAAREEITKHLQKS